MDSLTPGGLRSMTKSGNRQEIASAKKLLKWTPPVC